MKKYIKTRFNRKAFKVALYKKKLVRHKPQTRFHMLKKATLKQNTPRHEL